MEKSRLLLTAWSTQQRSFQWGFKRRDFGAQNWFIWISHSILSCDAVAEGSGWSDFCQPPSAVLSDLGKRGSWQEPRWGENLGQKDGERRRESNCDLPQQWQIANPSSQANSAASYSASKYTRITNIIFCPGVYFSLFITLLLRETHFRITACFISEARSGGLSHWEGRIWSGIWKIGF